LKRLGRAETDLQGQPRSHPLKLALAARLMRETALTLPEIAQPLRVRVAGKARTISCIVRNKPTAKGVATLLAGGPFPSI
jgi:hypothetical protein